MNYTDMTETVVTTRELGPDELNMAAGGTFTPNTYRKSEYHSFGISTSYNFFAKDEFRFMGQSISIDMANDIVQIGRRVSQAINDGYNGANKIRTSESMFINAFNSQLYIKYGIKWNGVAGSDF